MAKADAIRSVFESSLADIHARTSASPADERKRCLILSGGVDTCAILAAAKKLGMTFAGAFTVITGDDSPDKGFAEAAAKEHNLEHYVIRLTPSELVDVYLPVCVELLECYDGMTLRNSLVVAAAFRVASEKGFTSAVVGDGADELFGGYSFMWGNEDDPAQWKEKRDSMCRKWTFATETLGAHYGITPHSPYMEPKTVEWALANAEREDCIAERPIRLVYGGEYIDHITGKVILREAYDTVSSWRRKDPIEVGSGVTVIGHDPYWKDIVSDEEFERSRKELLERGFDIKTKEYLVNFRAFETIFGKDGEKAKRKRLRMGEGCVGCCFDIGDEMFCRMCGSYPAQRSLQETSQPPRTYSAAAAMPPHQPGRAPRRPQARQASQRGRKEGRRRIVRARRPPSPVEPSARPIPPETEDNVDAGPPSPVETEVEGGVIGGALDHTAYEEAVAAASAVVYADLDAQKRRDREAEMRALREAAQEKEGEWKVTHIIPDGNVVVQMPSEQESITMAILTAKANREAIEQKIAEKRKEQTAERQRHLSVEAALSARNDDKARELALLQAEERELDAQLDSLTKEIAELEATRERANKVVREGATGEDSGMAGNAGGEDDAGLVSSSGEDEDSSFVPSDSGDEGGSANRFDLLADEAESSDEGSGGEEDTPEGEGGGSNSNRFGLLMDEESSSSEESGSELDDSSSGGLGSNPFNVLVYGESSSEDDRSELTESVSNLSTTQHNNDDDSLDDDCTKCAVCFLPDDQCDTWRRLLTLPCCGLEGKEASSSTRFCAACILRMATTKSDPSVSNEYPRSDPDRFQPPTGQFYRNDVQTDTRRVIECPRCRDLLVVKIKKPRANESADESYCDCPDCIRSKEGDSNPQNAQSISVRIPLFEEKVRYAGKKVGAGGPVAGMLWRAAFLHHGFMPGMCLGPEADCEKLVRWGIVQQAPETSIPFLQGRKKKKDVFQMGWEDQAKLTEVLDLERAQNEEGYSIFEEDGSPGFEEGAKLLAGAGFAIFRFAMTFRLLGAVRLVNRFLTLILTFKGYVPMFPHSACRQWVVTALNVFVVATLLQFLFVTLLYAGCFLAVGWTVCYFLRSKIKAVWWQVVLAAFFAWRLATYVYDNPSLTWLGWVAPKSVVAIKSLLWA
ncbi:hypothetical protein ACHAXT_007601 [Thalassiosira profunda]